MTAPERITYLARRHPSFASRAAWVPRWREHWALAAAQPESATVRRYVQCEVLFDTAATPRDAVASAEYVSPEARLRNRSAQDYHAIMRADELQVFDRGIRECSFIGTHHVLAGEGRGMFKIVRFVRHAASVATSDFAAAWADWAFGMLDGGDGILGYAQTRALPPPGPEGWGLAVEGCEELWFADPDSARGFLSGPLAAATATAPFVVTDAVVTDEVALKDAPPLPEALGTQTASGSWPFTTSV